MRPSVSSSMIMTLPSDSSRGSLKSLALMRRARICFASHPGTRQLRRNAVNLRVAVVAGDQLVAGVVHRQTLDDVVHRVVEAIVLDRELLLNGVALPLFGKVVDPIGQPEAAHDDRQHERQGAARDPFRLTRPIGQNLAGRDGNDRRHRKILRRVNRQNPIGAVHRASLMRDAVAAASDILGIEGALGDVAAEHEFNHGRARHQSPVAAEQFDRPVVAEAGFLEHVLEHRRLHEAAHHAEKGAVGGGDALRHPDAGHVVDILERRRNEHVGRPAGPQAVQVLARHPLVIGLAGMRRVEELPVGVDDRQAAERRLAVQAFAQERLHVLVGGARRQVADRPQPRALQALDRRGNRRSQRLQRPIDVILEKIGKGLRAASAFVELTIMQKGDETSAADQNGPDQNGAGGEQRGLPPHQSKTLAKEGHERNHGGGHRRANISPRDPCHRTL